MGGEAVELYTGGQFKTGDIDLITGSREALVSLLKGLSFQEVGTIRLHEGLGIAVHIVGESYQGSEVGSGPSAWEA